MLGGQSVYDDLVALFPQTVYESTSEYTGKGRGRRLRKELHPCMARGCAFEALITELQESADRPPSVANTRFLRDGATWELTTWTNAMILYNETMFLATISAGMHDIIKSGNSCVPDPDAEDFLKVHPVLVEGFDILHQDDAIYHSAKEKFVASKDSDAGKLSVKEMSQVVGYLRSEWYGLAVPLVMREVLKKVQAQANLLRSATPRTEDCIQKNKYNTALVVNQLLGHPKRTQLPTMITYLHKFMSGVLRCQKLWGTLADLEDAPEMAEATAILDAARDAQSVLDACHILEEYKTADDRASKAAFLYKAIKPNERIPNIVKTRLKLVSEGK